ncbi:MAG TPA: enoyl-CoA hydratase-related protein [Acidimicrobiia bacterium]|nr:enoyl-CoA hydratase-related protein [Acidimicrobiia bacterium]
MAVSYDLRGDVALLTLDRPDRFNAVTQDLSDGLVGGLQRAGDEARAAVITGAGKAFCSGADLSDLMGEYETGGPDLSRVIGDRFNPMVEALLEAPLPTVAAVNGAAAGAGMGLALACDLRLMAESAFFLSAFIGLALIPDTGTTWLLPHHLGLSRAMELTFSNRRMPAAEALDLGLAVEVVPVDSLVERAMVRANGLTDGPTAAYVATRRLLVDAVHSEPNSALEREQRTQGDLGNSADHLEGMKAFLEKRPPDFRS